VCAAWSNAWIRAGGESEPDPAGLAWLYGYVAENPLVGPGSGRRIVAVEHRLRARFAGFEWQAQPDVLLETADGTIVAVELTSARNPLLDRQAVCTMAAIDQLVLAGPQAPACLRARPHLVVVCALPSYGETNVTLPWASVVATLIDAARYFASPGVGSARARWDVPPMHTTCFAPNARTRGPP